MLAAGCALAASNSTSNETIFREQILRCGRLRKLNEIIFSVALGRRFLRFSGFGGHARIDARRRRRWLIRRLGILFSPEEKLSVSFKDRMTKAAKQAGLQVTAAPVSSVGEVGEAARSLCGQKVNAIELYGNVAHAGFASLIKVARECKVAVFSPAPFEVLQGAVASFFPDFQEGGVEAGKMIARVLKGESPAKIPFYRLKTTKLMVNPGGAGNVGVMLPPDLVKQADTVVGEGAKKK